MSISNLNTNPLLVSADAYINYSQVKPEHIPQAIKQLIAQCRAAVEAACNSDAAPTWENLVLPIEDYSEKLYRAWSIAGHLNNVVNTTELRAAYNECLPHVSEFSTWIGLHEGLYKRYQQLYESPEFDKLSPTRQHIVRLTLRDFRLSGVELKGQARATYAKNSELQAQMAQKFSENVLDATDQWSLVINDSDRLKGLPEDVIAAAKQAALPDNPDAYKLSLHMPCYLPVMQYAEDRELRQTMYRAFATRASEQGDLSLDNSEPIESLLALRAEEAKLLGYDSFATLRLQTRMAENAGQVMAFLRDLAKKARPSAERDLAELRLFAKENLGLEQLEPWDVAYASERLRQQKYFYSDEELRAYFTEPKVLQGLFKVIQQLFGVQLELIEAPSWHPDAKIYRVLDQNGNELGRLGMDLYARAGKQGGAWVDSERNRRLRDGHVHTPLAWLTCNFPPPQGARPALLSHDDVITLFHESGHAMHTLLSKVDDLGAAAFNAVEWDAIELPSQFMENFCWEWDVLQSLSSHVDTGAPLPRELYTKMLSARNFQSGLQALRQVEFALFDMSIHTQNKGLSITQVLDALDQVRKEIALILPPSWHRFPHAFSHLFAGGYAAGYYSYKWAEVLSADAFSAFEEQAQELPDGGRNIFDKATSKRYLDEIIAIGGARPAADSFRAFRGRDPEIEALLRHSGLLEYEPV